MNRTKVITGLLVLSMFSATAQTTEWTFDKTHSEIQFVVAHMVIAEISGQFQDYQGIVLADEADFSDAIIEFSIDAESIDTDDENRDGHLRSDDFFDAAKYPNIIFKSKSVKRAGENQYKLTGDFTMHGVTKEIILDVKYGGTVTDPYGNVKAGFKITGTINRIDFGLKYNSVMDAGELMIGEDVTITCRVELLKSE